MKLAKKFIEIKGEQLIITNQRVIYWPSKRILILSDLHIGKAAHFRKHGIAVPGSVQIKDLERLDNLIAHFDPLTILIVGDLFHAGRNSEVADFTKWRAKHNTIQFHLIKGNHDNLSIQFCEQHAIKVFENRLDIAPFRFIHEPESDDKLFCIAGHIHPGVSIKSKGRQRITMPCYRINSNQMILPAFSLFTGLHVESVQEKHRYFVFTPEEIFEF
ncbi:MAG: ligase-associated DNA damage response endonuclease PdeM [bacterium]